MKTCTAIIVTIIEVLTSYSKPVDIDRRMRKRMRMIKRKRMRMRMREDCSVRRIALRSS